MRRHVGSLIAVLFLSSCTPGGLQTLQDDLTRAAQEQLKSTLATHFKTEMGKGLDTVISGLAQAGGYLDNPLVRILLPPPLGLAIGIAHDLSIDPQATLLETLINQAAEQAIPGAAPILQTALSQITPTQARVLLDGANTAGTEHLKAQTLETLQTVLTPIITEKLGVNGAQQVYSELLTAQQSQYGPPRPEEVAAASAPTPDLGQYVTQQAVTGMFDMLGTREASIREDLRSITGSVLQPMGMPPAEPLNPQAAPAAELPEVK